MSAESWTACKQEFGADQAVLVGVGYRDQRLAMVASILDSLEIPLEDDVVSWPPDGRPPSWGLGRPTD